jgi:hypothetical protein
MKPTLLVGVNNKMKVAQEEIFGPVAEGGRSTLKHPLPVPREIRPVFCVKPAGLQSIVQVKSDSRITIQRVGE